MKKIKLLTFFLTSFLLGASMIYAQNGQNDVRLIQGDVICPGGPIDYIIEVRASAPGREFFMSEQNYRFSFNREALANPTIVEELDVSGFVPGGPGPLGFTLYSPHNLIGSLDTVVSYNVELAGGDGLFMVPGEDAWVQVGRIGFDVLSEDACFDLVWVTQAIFPPTFVGEVYTDPVTGLPTRGPTAENFYGDYSNCMPALCFPVELVYFNGEERDCEIHLAWQTATETNSDYFIIERSFDAITFNEIGRVGAAGESQEFVNYNFTDIGINAETYYRLKQVDFDGSTDYSDVIKIHATCFEDGTEGDILDVYPNPVGGEGSMFLKVYSPYNETATISIMDITGKIVRSELQDITDGPNLLNFSVSGLAAGAYFIRIDGKDWYSSAQKIIKTND